MEIIIEEISHGKKLLGRHKFASDKITIGRGYNNDIIITDPHVCAQHLELNFDGENWVASDLGSINGSRINGKKNVNQQKITSGDVFTIGKSQIRILFPNHYVEDSIPVSGFEGLINWAKHPVVIAFNILIFGIIAGWFLDLNNQEDVTNTKIIVPTLMMLLGFSVWPALISVISFFTKKDARFWFQMGVSFVFFNLIWLSDAIESIVYFNTSSNTAITWLSSALPIVITFCLLWVNFYIGFHMTQKRRNITAAVLTALMYGGGFIIELSQKPEFSTRPNFDRTLMSPMFLLTSSSDFEQFIDDGSALFEKADEAVKKDKEE